MRKKNQRAKPHMNIFNNVSAKAWIMLIHPSKCPSYSSQCFLVENWSVGKKKLLTLP